MIMGEGRTVLGADALKYDGRIREIYNSLPNNDTLTENNVRSLSRAFTAGTQYMLDSISRKIAAAGLENSSED